MIFIIEILTIHLDLVHPLLTIKTTIMENKDQYRAAAHRTINEIFNGIEKLEREINETVGEQKANIQAKWNTLQQNKETLQQSFNKLEAASEATWNEAQAHFETAKNEITQTINEVEENFTA